MSVVHVCNQCQSMTGSAVVQVLGCPGVLLFQDAQCHGLL